MTTLKSSAGKSFTFTDKQEADIARLWALGMGDGRIGITLKIPSHLVRRYCLQVFPPRDHIAARAQRKMNGLGDKLTHAEIMKRTGT